MKAIIPAAGSGTRLRPQTHTVPKPLVNVAGRPILGHILDGLEKIGIDRIGFILGERGEKIAQYVSSAYKFELDYINQPERLGLGHAIYLYLKEKGFSDEPVLIILSDTVFEADLSQLLDSQYSSIGVNKVDDPQRFGIVELEDIFIKKLVEKPTDPTSNLAIVGIYFIKNTGLLFECLQRLIDENIRTRGEYQLTDALQMMVERGEKMTTFPIEGWYDCGSPENLLKTNRHLLGKMGEHCDRPGCIVIPPVCIANSAVIEKSIIGPYVSIAAGSRVTDSIIRDAIINQNAIIRTALIKDSLIGDGAIFNGQFTSLNIGDSSEITLKQ